MEYLLTSVISLLIFFTIGKISIKFKLVDIPNKRKIHKKMTPYTGGFAIALIFIFIIFISDFSEKNLNNLLVGAFIIAIFGLLDDKLILSVGSKLIFQLIPIIYLVFHSNIFLEDIGNYPLIGILKLGSFAQIFTVLCVFFIINASNYLDGLDGVLAINFLISLFSLFFFNQNLHEEFSIFLIYISLPIFIFLLFNHSLFNFIKIFLGDSGSFLIGYILSFIMILAYTRYGIDISLIVWSLSFLVYEFLSVNILRLINSKPFFRPSMDHIHHLIFKKNNSILKTNIYLIFIQILLIGFGYLIFELFGDKLSMISFIIFFPIFLSLRIFFFKNLTFR